MGELIFKDNKILIQKSDDVMSLFKGGQGSGNFGHSGRLGEVGGSSNDGSDISYGAKNKNNTAYYYHETKLSNLKSIQENGLLQKYSPIDKKTTLFMGLSENDSKGYGSGFGVGKIPSIMIRVDSSKINKDKIYDNGSGSVIEVNENIPSKYLEIKVGNKWKSIDSVKINKAYLNEHAARLQNPDKFDSFARKNNRFGEGIHAIFGIKDNRATIQSIRFNKDKYSVDEAKKWLKEHDYKPISFEVAKDSVQKQDDVMSLLKGGSGSGNFGHSGRIGEVGGSDDGNNNSNPPIKTYNYDRVKLSENYTIDELIKLDNWVKNKPENKNPQGSFNIYTPKAKKILDNIGWAISYKQKNKGEQK